MSRLAGLVLVLLGSVAFADDAETPAPTPKTEAATPAAKSTKFPLRVVKVLPKTEQALLFDQNRGRHVLVEVGDTIGDYTVSAIGEDEVTLGGKDLPIEVVLASPDAKPKQLRKSAAVDAAPADPYADAKAPADPYADAKAPADPYADDGEAETEEPIRAVTWGQPPSLADGDKTTVSPVADAEPPKPSPDVAKRGSMSKTDEASVMADAMVTATATPPPTNASSAPLKLSKQDVSAALADFGALAASIDASFAKAGLEIKSVKPGSVFAKAGLAAGDIITAVDGKPLKTLDDAADLYARAGAMKTSTVQVIRAGKPQTLRVTIQ